MDYAALDFGVGGVALNLHGQHITSSGLGGYFALPFALAATGDDGGAGLGNLELGGLYAIRRGDLEAYARGGVALGTSSVDESMEDVMPIANLLPRPADALTTWRSPIERASTARSAPASRWAKPRSRSAPACASACSRHRSRVGVLPLGARRTGGWCGRTCRGGIRRGHRAGG